MRVAAACTASDRVPCSSGWKEHFPYIRLSNGDDIRPRETSAIATELSRFLSSDGDFRIRQRMSRDTRSLNDVLIQREKLADDRKSSGAQWRTYSVVAVSCAGNFRVNQPGVSSFLSLIVLRFYRRGNWEGYTQKITLSVWAFRPETRTVSPQKRF